MKLLNHPNIVKLFEVIETKNTLFLVMEYSSGGELYDYLVVHGRMKEKEARVKFRQILAAVNYCHNKRVIHRDLKVIYINNYALYIKYIYIFFILFLIIFLINIINNIIIVLTSINRLKIYY